RIWDSFCREKGARSRISNLSMPLLSKSPGESSDSDCKTERLKNFLSTTWKVLGAREGTSVTSTGLTLGVGPKRVVAVRLQADMVAAHREPAVVRGLSDRISDFRFHARTWERVPGVRSFTIVLQCQRPLTFIYVSRIVLIP